ncbi:MAG TPA: metalloregulator ArsR/SmtB family transcription factor, partial [Ardenticatenaceae bacterium]|nr:metalloregulator ArsR/SmtB family transcription factor [Ardenticatenaceae bacterium]
FFKVLSDGNRLKIIGLLAQKPHTVEHLAAVLDVGVSTVSHHLSRLARAGLVSARADGYYSVYSLQTDVLAGMARRLLSQETLPKLAEDVDPDAFDRKVLATFLDADGRLKAFPTQEKKFLAVLRYVVRAFEPGVRYSEKQVNEILGRFHQDTALLRRRLVDHQFMAREGGGGAYWRLDADQAGA